MASRRPLVVVGGAPAELPAADNLSVPQAVLGQGTTQSDTLGVPAVRLSQRISANEFYGGGAVMETNNGDATWLQGGICGVTGVPGNTSGYPGGLALLTKPADGSTTGALVERLRITMAGDVAIGAKSTATKLGVAGTIAHTADNTFSFGTAALRASTVYAGAGTINTSDAREKTTVAPLTLFEIAAATDLAREIGTFQFLASIAQKGEAEARHHVGMTVQRAIAILEAHGLDPLAYAFICHDTWEEILPTPAVEGCNAEFDEDGVMVRPPILPQAATSGVPAGERYGFRTDQLLLFIARGFEARLVALEARAA